MQKKFIGSICSNSRVDISNLIQIQIPIICICKSFEDVFGWKRAKQEETRK